MGSARVRDMRMLTYLQEHLEYILFELYKNAARYSMLRNAHGDVPPVIRTTIVSGDEDILIRVSDQGKQFHGRL